MAIKNEYTQSVSAFVRLVHLVIFVARQASSRQTTPEMEMVSSTLPSGSISEESPNEPTNPTTSDLASPESKEENQLVPIYKPRSPKELPSKRNSSHEIDLTQSDNETNEREVRSSSLTK